jgi:RHS repeat-associated protein
VVHDRSATLRTVQYTYDGLARLREARYLPGLRTSAADADLLRREQFAFDRAGNRTQQSIALNGGAPMETTYSYNAGNQMTSAGAATLTYDDNGNLTSGLSGATWVWDRANRAIMISNTPHQYDGLGNLIQGSWGKYLLDLQPSLSVVLRTTDGSFTENYVHSGRGLLAQQTDGQWFWSTPDGLGSIRGMVDNATLVRSYQNYDTFGNKTDGLYGVGMLYGFTGEMHDVDVYLRARQYRPSLGVFTSRDPFEGMAGRPMSLNGYSWVEGNVVNATDPSGMVYERPEKWHNCKLETEVQCENFPGWFDAYAPNLSGYCGHSSGRTLHPDLTITETPQQLQNWWLSLSSTEREIEFALNATAAPPCNTNAPSPSPRKAHLCICYGVDYVQSTFDS